MQLEKELTNDKLLKKDVKSVVERLTPFLRYLGILSGGITVGRHVVKSESRKKVDEKDDSRAEGKNE